MGVLGERKNELHVINSKEGADKTESKDDDDDTPKDEVIGLSTKKDSEEIMPLSVVIPDNYNPERLPKPPKGPTGTEGTSPPWAGGS